MILPSNCSSVLEFLQFFCRVRDEKLLLNELLLTCRLSVIFSIIAQAFCVCDFLFVLVKHFYIKFRSFLRMWPAAEGRRMNIFVLFPSKTPRGVDGCAFEFFCRKFTSNQFGANLDTNPCPYR